MKDVLKYILPFFEVSTNFIKILIYLSPFNFQSLSVISPHLPLINLQ